MNKNTSALTEKTKRKLDPFADRFLKTFKTIGVKAQRGEPSGAYAVTTLLQDLGDFSKHLAKYRISYRELPLPAKTNELIAKASELPQRESNLEQLLGLTKEMRNNSGTEKFLTDPLLKPLKSLRSNRSPKPAFEKFAHRAILTILFPVGALPKTKSFLSDDAIPKPLSNKELKEIFDWACPACGEPHKIEAVKKLKTRFLGALLARVSNDKGKKVSRIIIKQG